MTRVEALELARQHVAEVCKPPIKPNGYALDGWRPPTAPELVSMTVRVAEFLIGPKEEDQ